MTYEINGFNIEPATGNRYLFRRMTEPRHAYIFEITPKRIVLHATFPDDVGIDQEATLDNAESSEKDARKAAKELQRQTFGLGPAGRD
ncbi:MAG TPA: hypothetical protein VNO32_42375 [Candidatus Acidoferrum sp.]|jgi:hypothetical protein|nr:hypothetical protein [Candidatus Acidoferrum sp.]